MNITIVIGARPNFMKAAPILHEIKKKQALGHDIQYRLVHTGQHYDDTMSGLFFQELSIPFPDINLGVGSSSQSQQTADIMIRFEKELNQHPPDLVLVVGDVNSTMAAAITAKKMGIKVAHVEAGIRSFDNSMPEEINRKLTDSITDFFFTTSEIANANLIKEGVNEAQIFFVGNVMIDSLLANIERFQKPSFFDGLMLSTQNYFVLTIHRPNNVDDCKKLITILNEIDTGSHHLPVIFPVHPRTLKQIGSLSATFKNIKIVDPLSYLEFNYLVKYSKAVITDSGGITEETTVMGIPCLTLRDNTERPETCTIGTNELIGSNPINIKPYLEKIFSGSWKKGSIPQFWDGNSAERIVAHLFTLFKVI